MEFDFLLERERFVPCERPDESQENNDYVISIKALGEFRLNNFLEHSQTKRDIDYLCKVYSEDEDFDLFKEVRNYCVPDSIRKQDLEEAIDCLGEEKVKEIFVSKFKEKELVFYCADCRKGFDANSLQDTGNSEESFATCPNCGAEELPCITKTEFNQKKYNKADISLYKETAKEKGNFVQKGKR